MHLRWPIIGFFLGLPFLSVAQVDKSVAHTDNAKDSTIGIAGIILSADSLKPLPSVSVSVLGTGRGTITGENGLFHIDAVLGNVIELSSVGYKTVRFAVTSQLRQYNLVQYLEPDTVYMGNTLINLRPSRGQFERDFVNAPVDNQMQEIAKDNLNPAALMEMVPSLPVEASDITRRMIANNVEDMRSTNFVKGQVSLLSLLNPMAWAKFIQSMKKKQ